MPSSKGYVHLSSIREMGAQATNSLSTAVVPKHPQTCSCMSNKAIVGHGCTMILHIWLSISWTRNTHFSIFNFQTTPVAEMEDMVFCHACKKSGPTMVAAFSLFYPEANEQAGTVAPNPENETFSGHMEMYYFTAEDKPVTIMMTHLDLNPVILFCLILPLCVVALPLLWKQNETKLKVNLASDQKTKCTLFLFQETGKKTW